MIEVLSWHASPGLLTAGQHQGETVTMNEALTAGHHQSEPVTMIEVLTWPASPGLLTGGIEAPDGGTHQGEPVTMIEALTLASTARPVDRWPPPKRIPAMNEVLTAGTHKRPAC